MSKTVAIILSIVGGLLLLGIIIVGGGIYWVYQNSGGRVVKRIAEEASQFGAKTNNEGCVKEAVSRYRRDSSFSGRQLSPEGFMTICLQASKPSPGFCDGVPPPNRFEVGIWARKRCSDAGLLDDSGCESVFYVMSNYCHRSK